MKHKQLILLAAASIAASLASCGGGNTPASSPSVASSASSASSAISSASSKSSVSVDSSVPEVKYTVTFDLNYAGSTPIVTEVEEGETVAEPDGAVREGYGFAGWFTEATCENAFDFTTPITANITLYASWQQIDENTCTATFHWNLEGKEDVYKVLYFEKGSRLTTSPADPVSEGHAFQGWYLEATCENKRNQGTRLQDNVDYYAKWFFDYTLEAEYTQVIDLPDADIDAGLANEFGEKIGHGYSSDTYGLANIFPGRNLQASNDWYISNMYYYGAYIEFDIEADKAVSNAILIARLTCEYFDMSFEPGYYDFEVNGSNLDYDKISLKCSNTSLASAFSGVAPKLAEGGSGAETPFSNHTINTAVSLQQGKNVIKLITHNNDRQDNTGTMAAMAPLVDCIYLQTDAVVTFDAHTSNVENR